MAEAVSSGDGMVRSASPRSMGEASAPYGDWSGQPSRALWLKAHLRIGMIQAASTLAIVLIISLTAESALGLAKDGVSLRPPIECDQLAADPNDTLGVTAGVEFDQLDEISAIQACRKATSEFPEVKRFKHQLARALFKFRHFEEGKQVLSRLADGDYLASQLLLGQFLDNGKFEFPKDPAAAHRWHKQAAIGGNPVAMLELANDFLRSEGVNKNYETGIFWLKKSASFDVADAQYYMGLMYFNGGLVERNTEKALFWLNKAKSNNHLKSRITIFDIYEYLGICQTKKGMLISKILDNKEIKQHKDNKLQIKIKMKLANYYYKNKCEQNLNEALSLFEEVYEIFPASPLSQLINDVKKEISAIEGSN